ncbi:MAG: alkaline phosphatase family protein [Candidatus Hydrogenedentes bacterium]|nr:alkaline phosphatase family protein [Candidatus Hydrogenedentota bacterium]
MQPNPKMLLLTLVLMLLLALGLAVVFFGSGGAQSANAIGAPTESPAAQVAANAPKQAAPIAPAGVKKGRVVILGFDGVEPTIVDTMLDAGELPNLAKLRDTGSYARLTSAIPPQSPSAWSSFATCKNTGAHGIYDFITRDPSRYGPRKGFGSSEHAKLGPDGAVTEPAKFVSLRKGDSFWKIADQQGLKCAALLVPFAFPAEDLAQGCMLCGLGVTDIRGTDSTYFSFSESHAAPENVAGGILLPLSFTDNVASVTIPGARNPLKPYGSPEGFVQVPLEFTVDRGAKKVSIKTPAETLELAENEWSKWIEWSFEVSPKFTVKAISRFYAMEAGDQVNVYMACLQFHPKAPYIRLSTPETYSSELMDKYGLFKTIGWSFDTHAVRKDALSDDAFLEDVANSMTWNERLTVDEMDRNVHDMVIAAWTGPDRVSHMFWRFRDQKHPLYTEAGAKQYGRAVENTYKAMDGTVGKVMAKLAPDDLLMILSDHGFKSFRKGLNVNTWLVRNGFLNVVGQTDPATAYTTKDQSFLSGFDWTKSRAYSLGLGSIFINMKGREGQGIVSAEDADALAGEIRQKLLAFTDPETGEKLFDAIYTKEVFTGAASADAPDLQLGYADGFQSSKATVSGSAPEALLEINDDKWSGEHGSSDVANTPGIFFSNKKINTEKPGIIDLGVTALHYLGAAVPTDLEGKPLL